MHLHGEILIGIEQLRQPREAPVMVRDFPKQFVGVIFHEPPEIMSSEGAIGDDADGAGTIAYLPRFANALTGREWLVEKRLEASTSPDAFLEKGLERERIEHWLTPR